MDLNEQEHHKTTENAAESKAAIQQQQQQQQEEDDDVPTLSPYALEALKEFLASQSEERENEQQQESSKEKVVSLVQEDWRLSQFWYSPHTARTVATEVFSLLSPNASVACIACPTLFAYLKKMYPDISVQLLEYDKRFEQYGSEFTFYDYNMPLELPQAMQHSYQIVVADPPYLSEECLEKVARTIAFLAQPGNSFLLLLTGAVQKDRAANLLGLQPCGFRPEHFNKLGNEFRLYTNYDPGERLGGWQPEE